VRIQISIPYMSRFFFFLLPLVALAKQANVSDEELVKKARLELGSSSTSQTQVAPVEIELISTKVESEKVPDYGPASQLYLGAFPSKIKGSGQVSRSEKFSYDRLKEQPALSIVGGYWISNLGNGRLGVFGNFTFSTYSFRLSAQDRTNSGEMRINASSLSMGPNWESYFNRRISVVLSAYLGQLFLSQLGKTDALSNSQSLTFVGAAVSPQWHLSKRWQSGPFINANREISSIRDLQAQRIVYGIQLGHRF